MRFETIGKELDPLNLAKHNRNLSRADADLSSLQQQISTEQQARIAADNAHAGSTSAHPAQHITYSGAVAGAKNVKDALDRQNQRIDNIVASSGSDNSEIVDARIGADGIAHPVLKDRLDRMEYRQLEEKNQTQTLKYGANIIETSQATPATIEFKGRSSVNIPGKLGGFESLDKWTIAGNITLATNIKRSGTTSLRSAAENKHAVATLILDYELDKSKNYFVGAWVYVESFTSPGGFGVRIADYDSPPSTRYSASANTSIVGSWQFVYVKIPKSNTIIGKGVRIYAGTTTDTTGIAYIDELRLYEVSDADFAAIGTTIVGEDIDKYFPYVDGLQHAQGLSLRTTGRNLLAGIPDTLHANAVLNAPYDLTHNSTSADRSSSIISVIPGQQYTLSAELVGSNARIGIYENAVYKAGISAATPVVTYTATTANLEIRFNSTVAGKFDYRNWMLVLGGADQLPPSFEPYNPQYINAPIKLAANVDGSVADSYDSATGKLFRRWLTSMKLDASLPWEHYTNTNADTVELASNLTLTGINWTGIVETYTGEILPTVIGLNQLAPSHLLATNGTRIYLRLRRTDTGWNASLPPNTITIKALMNGWKANANNGSTYTSWVSILDGSTAPTNTIAYVSANKAPGWDCYATLDYALATPVVEDISGDLGGLLVSSGSSQLELVDGVIFNEPIVPRLSGTMYEINRTIGDVNNKLKHRGFRILGVYQNGKLDPQWKIYKLAATDYWTDGVGAEIRSSDYDPTAVYTVTYQVLDRYKYTAGIRQATLTYQSSPGSVIAKNAQNIADLQRSDGIQDWILAQHTARLLALEEA
ncbi:hypothetical protein [Paenibacillus sp. GXUN7292]|uniref:hypothetical protein n=1 Tax=Paenibacillus sp. GXUN7292 TaxID=3422499 RepID=UPI003D7D91EC